MQWETGISLHVVSYDALVTTPGSNTANFLVFRDDSNDAKALYQQRLPQFVESGVIGS